MEELYLRGMVMIGAECLVELIQRQSSDLIVMGLESN